MGAFSIAVGTGGNGALPGGPYFFEEIGKEHQGRRFLPLEPHSLVGGMGEGGGQVGAWPAASKTNASWPAHRLGRAVRWFVDGRKK